MRRRRLAVDPVRRRWPERVLGIVAFAVGVPLLTPPHPWRVQYGFHDELETDEGWAKLNEHYWRRDYPGFVRFFFGELTSEPHSTKVLEDIVGWALDGSVDAMLAEGGVESPWTLEAGRGGLPRRALPAAHRPRHERSLPAGLPRPPAGGADRWSSRDRRGRRPPDPGRATRSSPTC